ncbi:hypothetical protein CRUP_029675 [Coryphaenoides rupestris]|nr:hypothetical protein CRUP_029675 [Coryphaenoides rupestris]
MSPLLRGPVAGVGVDLCYPLLLNTSCRRTMHPRSQASVLYVLLSSVVLLTVLLNLLVIISISHFRQLHTPTNLVLLSMACSDLLIGLIVMPLEGLHFISGCWFLGQPACAPTYALSFTLISASIGSILLISVDRYVAICQPLRYSSTVTVGRVQLAVCLCWACCVLYNCGILQDNLQEPGRLSLCHGDCVVVVDMVSGAVDLLVTFLAPVSVVVTLYLRVFTAALSQARQMRSSRVPQSVARRSERKAAVTLGVVVVVFLMCFCPYFYPSFSGQDMSNSAAAWAWVTWLLFFNSCLNPLLYAIFYPWFRKAIRLIARQMKSSRVMDSVARRSERKAAVTLGVVVVVFLMCFCPYFYMSFLGWDLSHSAAAWVWVTWLMFLNSCLNPLLYAIFYPWKAIRLIGPGGWGGGGPLLPSAPQHLLQAGDAPSLPGKSPLSLLTVLLNLLVIISISHFRQLHTPTNLVLLSMACSDLLIGLIVMPLGAVYSITYCWFLGQLVCTVFFGLPFILTSASVGSILLISVDRYVAICQPLHYSSTVTVGRVQLAVCLCWACSVLYNCGILQDNLQEPGRLSLCHGDCVGVVDMVSGAVDLLVTFLAPVSVVVMLYLRVFTAALSQARQMRSSRVAKSVARRSERKAAVTLGVVVVVFLMCFCPYFYPSFAGQDMSNSVAAGSWLNWLLFFNSCLNPLIYAIFYPWFRKAIRLIRHHHGHGRQEGDQQVHRPGHHVNHHHAIPVAQTQPARLSERKAAVTLGVVVVVFLMCFCPYFYPSFSGQDMSNSAAAWAWVTWLLFFNSCLNPLLYAIFYPWFRKAIRLIARQMKSSRVMDSVARRSERKAAVTLGVVVVVFLMCFCPYFYMSFLGWDLSHSAAAWVWVTWLMFLNSCLNPLLYAIFYPWKAIRLIVTLQILQPGSCQATIF